MIVRGDDSITARNGYQRPAALTGTASQLFSATANDASTGISSMASPTNGFTVGTNAGVNASAATYDYVAFTDLP